MPTLLEQPRRTRPSWADGAEDAPYDGEAAPPPPPPDGPGEGDGDGDDDGGGDDGDRDGGDGGPGRLRWVTVATFWKPTDAHLARIHLENEGIDVVILDETLVAMDWFMANAVGGIKLQVPEPDSAVARSLLATGGGGDARLAALADGEPVSDGQTLCPRCGSDAIYPARLSRRMAFVSILLLGLPLPMLLRRSRCAGCGFEWRVR